MAINFRSMTKEELKGVNVEAVTSEEVDKAVTEIMKKELKFSEVIKLLKQAFIVYLKVINSLVVEGKKSQEQGYLEMSAGVEFFADFLLVSCGGSPAYIRFEEEVLDEAAKKFMDEFGEEAQTQPVMVFLNHIHKDFNTVVDDWLKDHKVNLVVQKKR